MALSDNNTRPSLKLLLVAATFTSTPSAPIITIQGVVGAPVRMVRRGVTGTVHVVRCRRNATHFAHFLLFGPLLALPDLHRLDRERAAQLLLQALSIVGLVVAMLMLILMLERLMMAELLALSGVSVQRGLLLGLLLPWKRVCG